MVSETTKQTEATLTHHIEAMDNRDIDAIVSDYTEESVLFTPYGLVHRLQEIRSRFEGMLNFLPPEMSDAMEIMQHSVEGEVAYLLWKAEPFFSMGTDTFVVRDGKIIIQTYAAYMPTNV